jgi:hypothetical protein
MDGLFRQQGEKGAGIVWRKKGINIIFNQKQSVSLDDFCEFKPAGGGIKMPVGLLHVGIR